MHGYVHAIRVCKKIGVTVHTLQRWDREGRLIAKRTPTNRRYYVITRTRTHIGS
ncbi:MAG: MerR family DNA-binding transcriptional regulator [Chloroflexota bacterium]|nr:MerR family DNA-binding transcriptional regulator [Chloroflexota bacterium]